MWNQISACFIFTWPDKMYPLLSAIYLDLVSYLMEPTGTGQVNVTCPVSSTLSYRNISPNAVLVHVWGDWQHLKRSLSKGGKTVMKLQLSWICLILEMKSSFSPVGYFFLGEVGHHGLVFLGEVSHCYLVFYMTSVHMANSSDSPSILPIFLLIYRECIGKICRYSLDFLREWCPEISDGSQSADICCDVSQNDVCWTPDINWRGELQKWINPNRLLQYLFLFFNPFLHGNHVV
jgi:hypothetical protein